MSQLWTSGKEIEFGREVSEDARERERERERRWSFVSMTAMGVLRWFFDNIKCPGANYLVCVTFWMYL